MDSTLVAIFDAGPDVEPVSVAEQRVYAEAVLGGGVSLKRSSGT
jgi:hypothetical protein